MNLPTSRNLARSFSRLVALTLLVATGLPMHGSPAAAQDGDPGALDGRFRLGYRFVDVGGTETKYQEDFGLEEGARLFELRLDWESPEAVRDLVDRVFLDLDGFGGDPYESLHLRVERHGSFDFRFDRTESTYFYNDTILPHELSDPSVSNAGDFHTFDFDRVRDTANLRVNLSPAAQLNVGFERFTRKGESTTVYDVARDEFELDAPIDESYDDFFVGFQYAWPKVTLVLEERVRDFENAAEAFLPGASVGENPDNATTLDFYRFDRPYTLESNHHTVRINARPTDRWLISASALLFDFEIEAEAVEVARGTSFDGSPLETVTLGGGEVERDGELFDLDFTYLINERWAVVGGARNHTFDQEGDIDYGSDQNVGLWDVDTTTVELGVETSLRPGLTLSVGAIAESRDVEHAFDTDGGIDELEETSTDHDGFFTRLGYSAGNGLRLDLSLEDSSYDDPFALASPTDRERWRLRASWAATSGFHVDGTYLAYRFENGDSGWKTDRDQLTGRFGWRSERVDASLGYSVIEADREVDQLVTTLPGFGGGVEFLYPVLYRSDSDFLDAHLRWRPSDRVSVGVDLRNYENAGTFALERDDYRGFVEFGFLERYLVNLAYRTIDYNEVDFNYDDYDADIFEVSVGYQF